MLGEQVRPLPTDEPGAVLLLTHRTLQSVCCTSLTGLAGWRSAILRRPFTSRRVLQNAGGNAPIAKTLDRDLGLIARYLANSRSAGHAALNFETQSLGGGLGICRNGKVDEIGHADLPVSDLVREFRAQPGRARGTINRESGIKNPCESEHEFAKSKSICPNLPGVRSSVQNARLKQATARSVFASFLRNERVQLLSAVDRARD